MVCPLCNSNNIILIRDKIKNSEICKIYSCKECNYIFLYPNYDNNLEIYNTNSQDKDRFENLLRDRDDWFNQWIITHQHRSKFLKQNINININKKYDLIDIGGGYGLFLSQFLKDNNYNLNINMLEPGKERINIAKQYLKDYEVNFIQNILDNNFANNNKNKYDIITCIHVLEHVKNPINFLNNCYDILKNNGIIFIEVPNQDFKLIEECEEYLQKVHYTYFHISYFNKTSLNYLCELSKFNTYSFSYYQSYGIYNYLDWIRYKEPQNKVDYFKNEFRSFIEKKWHEELINTGKSDCIRILLKK